MAGRRLTGGQKKKPARARGGLEALNVPVDAAGYDIADFSARLILPFAFRFVVAFAASAGRGWAALPFD